MSGDQASGRRTAEKAKIICPHPSRVDIIRILLLQLPIVTDCKTQKCLYLKTMLDRRFQRNF